MLHQSNWEGKDVWVQELGGTIAREKPVLGFIRTGRGWKDREAE